MKYEYFEKGGVSLLKDEQFKQNTKFKVDIISLYRKYIWSQQSDLLQYLLYN